MQNAECKMQNEKLEMRNEERKQQIYALQYSSEAA